jgi:hypothetical protein
MSANRLKSVLKGGATTSFTYGPDGARASKTTNFTGASVTTNYFGAEAEQKGPNVHPLSANSIQAHKTRAAFSLQGPFIAKLMLRSWSVILVRMVGVTGIEPVTPTMSM